MNKLKYLGYSIVFQEVPNEVSLAVNISGCPHKCEGCHSKYLWEYDGNYISDDIDNLIKKYQDLITCVCFMGGDQNLSELAKLLYLVKSYGLKTALYTGEADSHIIAAISNLPLDYIKYGPYIEKYGAISTPTTNQVMLKRNGSKWEDITYVFQRR